MQQATLAKLAITSAVALGGVGFLVYSSVAQAQHYKMVDDLVAGGLDGWDDKELKVHGFVQAGSIIDTIVDHEMQHEFILENRGKQIRVFIRGPVPDTFNDRAEVVATGHLLRASTLQPRADVLCRYKHGPACPIQLETWALDASEVTAKCPEHYDKAARPMPPPSYR